MKQALPKTLVVALTLVTVGCGTSSTSSSNDEPAHASVASAILKGEPDTTHTGVVAVVSASSADFPQGGFCSGALVAANVVLTARHCVSALEGVEGQARCLDSDAGLANRPKAPVPAKEMSVIFDADTLGASAAKTPPAAVRRIDVPPDTTGKPDCGFDVALLELASPSDATVITPRLDGPPRAHSTFTAVGYGYDGADTSSWGVRRSRSGLTVSRVGAWPVLDDLYATANDWVAAEGPCGGDSGSPALADDGTLVGVMSRGPATLCTDMVYTRVDVFGDWLRTTVADASSAAGLAPPAWAQVDGSAVAPDAGAAAPVGDAATSASTSTSCDLGAHGPGRAPAPIDASAACAAALTLLLAARRRGTR